LHFDILLGFAYDKDFAQKTVVIYIIVVPLDMNLKGRRRKKRNTNGKGRKASEWAKGITLEKNFPEEQNLTPQAGGTSCDS